MNVTCIYTTDNYFSVKKPLNDLMGIHLGLAFVATALKKSGFTTRLLVLTPRSPVESILEEHIQESRPLFFGLTAAATQYPFVLEVARKIKKIEPAMPVLLGGHHATLNPEEPLREKSIDAVCIGEGEEAAVEFAAALKENGTLPLKVKNLWVKNMSTGKIIKNECRPYISPLDRLPFIDVDMWKEWVYEPGSMMNVQVGRGCPNRCTYCSNHALARIAPGEYVRFRSPESVAGEIMEIIKHHPSVSSIYLRAETLSVDTDYTSSLCERLKALNRTLKKPLRFMLSLSPGKHLIRNERFLRSLKEANVATVCIGLESGSERLRTEVLRRPRYSNKDIITLCRKARDLGIRVSLCNLIGLPGERLSDFNKTVSCVRACRPFHAHLYIFYPYPGTDLFRKVQEMGLLQEKSSKTVTERRIARYSLPGFSKLRIQLEYFLFSCRVFKGRMPFYKIAGRVLREIAFLHPGVNAFIRKVIHQRWLRNLTGRITTDPKKAFYRD